MTLDDTLVASISGLDAQTRELFESEIAKQPKTPPSLTDLFFRMFVDNSPSATYFISANSVIYMNPSFTQLTGYSTSDFENPEKLMKLIHEEDLPKAIESIKDLFAKGTSSGDYRFRRKDGEIIHVASYGQIITFEGVSVFCTSIIDRSKVHETEMLLEESKRMEAMGNFAAGLAHDINSLITTLRGNIQMAQRAIEKGNYQNVSEILERAILAESKVTGTIAELLEGIHPRMYSGVVTSSFEALNGFHVAPPSEGHYLATDFSSREKFMADPRAIYRAITNLVVNSFEAMPSGGTVNVNSQDVNFKGNKNVPEGKYVTISVSDNGSGIHDANLKRIFEPLFTTKGGNGHGFGLSQVWGIVHDLGGYIDVRSKVGEGTKIDLYFPLIAKKE